ncbi:hypothetical protein NA78x_004944 [Anatilimnocola sp. NA78]|uniref:hypothetical protein n=1 Tax=Anatilimnocola sp. NA78 TaxID=3415683 RepID=UPI003CE59E31
MNRSLEALAIFAICLGGILAAVRISSKDQSVPGRNMAERPATPAVPAKGSSSASEQPAVEGCVENGEHAPADNSALAYEQGCGLDRAEGRVYSAFPPLVSPEAFVRSVIRSQPLPVHVLPEATEVETVATGYDTAYDAAMQLTTDSAEFSYEEMAAEYAAAELAAAEQSEQRGTFSDLGSETPENRYAAWYAVRTQWHSLMTWSGSQTAHADFAYLAPARRALEVRWSNSTLSAMMSNPKVRSQARRDLLLKLFRHRAEVTNDGRITWDDYLGFADRQLAQASEGKSETIKTSRLFPRPPKKLEQDTIWSTR